MGFQTNNRDEKAVDLVTGDKNEDEEKDKKPRFELAEYILDFSFAPLATVRTL